MLNRIDYRSVSVESENETETQVQAAHSILGINNSQKEQNACVYAYKNCK